MYLIQLNIRITEDKNHIRQNISFRFIIIEYKMQFEYDFDWENISILDEESCYNKRLISEMLYIKYPSRHKGSA